MPDPPALRRLATAVLVLAALPFAAVLIRSVRELHAGLTADQLAFFYVVPAVWLAGTGVALRSSNAVRLSIALALMSLGLALGAAELGLGVWLRGAASTPASSSILTEVRRLRAAGENVYPRIPGNSIVDLNPDFGADGDSRHAITPAPGNVTVVLCNESGPLRTYSGDRFGFDNPDPVWEGEAPEVAVIGDSYTVGVCVGEGESIPDRLRSSHRVLDLGMSGAGPLQELAILREYAKPLAPRFVVWIYYEGNDLWDLQREAEREWLRAYLDEAHSQRLAESRTAVDPRYRAWIDSLVAVESIAAGATRTPPDASLLADALHLRSLRRLARFGVLSPTRESPLGLLPDVLLRARDDVAAWGGRLIVAYMPAYERYAAVVGEALPGRRELLSFAETNAIRVIDLHGAFSASGDPKALWTSPQGHLGPDGYAVAARAIAAALGESER
jgi:lysophospholipase L1-like esterase